MRQRLLVLLALLVLGGLAAWWLLRPRPTDEERLYRLLTEISRAVELRSPAGVLRHLSESYQDAYGNNKRTLTQQVYGGLRSVERLTVVPEITALKVSGDTATMQVHARVWFGQPGSAGGTDLTVNLRLARERGRWLVIWAEGWEPAEEAYMNQGAP